MELSWVFNFAILFYLRNLRKSDACEIYVFCSVRKFMLFMRQPRCSFICTALVYLSCSWHTLKKLVQVDLHVKLVLWHAFWQESFFFYKCPALNITQLYSAQVCTRTCTYENLMPECYATFLYKFLECASGVLGQIYTMVECSQYHRAD